MKYGFCPICGEYGKLEEPGDKPPETGFRILHSCPPKWLCTFGEEGEHDDHAIYAPSARQAAEKYAEWYDRQYCCDEFREGWDQVVRVTDEHGVEHGFDTESEVVREYHASEQRRIVHGSQPTSHGTIVDTRIAFETTKDGKTVFPEIMTFERRASPEDIDKLKKEQHDKERRGGPAAGDGQPDIRKDEGSIQRP